MYIFDGRTLLAENLSGVSKKNV